MKPFCLAGAVAVSIASVKDAVRRPLTWIAAALCCAFLMASSFLLPVSDPSDLPRMVASLSGGVLFLLASAASAAIPAAMVFARRQEGFDAAAGAVPCGKIAASAGTIASAAAAVTAVWALFAALQAAAIAAACAISPDGCASILPSMEYLPDRPDARVEIKPGETATFVFAPVSPPPPAGRVLRCEIDPWLVLARPDSEEIGSPVDVAVLSRGIVVSETKFASARKGHLVFEVEPEHASSGFSVELRPGPSPFDLAIEKGGVIARGAADSIARNFALCALSSLAFALMIASFSALGSSFLSLPVAVTFAAGIALAAVLAPAAAGSLEFIERAGLADAHNRFASAPAWLPLIGNLASAVCAVIPDAWSLNRSDFLSSGRRIPAADVAADCARCAIAAVAAAIASVLVASRREPTSP